MRFLLAVQANWNVAGYMALGILSLLGAVALVAPKLFARLAQQGSRWVDTDKLLRSLDKRFDIDRFVLPYSRYLGAAVLLSVGLLVYQLIAP